MKTLEKTRGKRLLACLLLLSLGILTVLGLENETAWEMARFYTPWIFPSALTLFVGDAYFASKLQLPTS